MTEAVFRYVPRIWPFYTTCIRYTFTMFVATAAICLGQLMSGSVNLSVSAGGKKVGSAQVSYRITNSGTKLNQTKMEISVDAAKMTIVQESEYAADGTPIRSFLRTAVFASGKNSTETVTMLFANGAAEVKIEKQGKVDTRKIAPQAGSEIRRKDEFWFLTSKPAVGQTFVCRHFDPNTLTWAQLSSKYSGVEQLAVGKVNVRAHHIKTNQYDYWLDDAGAPLMLKSSAFIMVRE